MTDSGEIPFCLRVLHFGRTAAEGGLPLMRRRDSMNLLRRFRIPVAQLALLGLIAAPVALPSLAFANHSVLIEGEEDYDGDGRIGSAEDTDGADGIFGKINTALSAATGALNQNGTAVIVTSGRFPEVVSITGPVTLEAAPGVEAVIEAFLSPAADPNRLADFDTMMSNNMTRQMAPGIIVNVPTATNMPNPALAGLNDRPVVIRNVSITNWTDGIAVMGGKVLIDGVRIEHNVNHGINVMGTSQVAIVNTSVSASGFRLNPASGDFPRVVAPAPGIGIRYRNTSTGDIQRSSSTNNFAAGLSTETARVRDVNVRDVQFFGNGLLTPSFTNLINACRIATNRNQDEAEICFQAVQRIVLGIPETP
jgi:hypothetical protein